MINNRVVKGGFKTSALLMLALTGCQTVNTNPSAPSERVPYVQLPIFIGKLFVANRPRLVNRAFTIKIKADGLVGHFFNVITVVDFVI